MRKKRKAEVFFFEFLNFCYLYTFMGMGMKGGGWKLRGEREILYTTIEVFTTLGFTTPPDEFPHR